VEVDDMSSGLRRLTQKAEMNYETKVAEYNTKLQAINALQERTVNITKQSSIEEISAFELSIYTELEKFQNIAKSFSDYLINTRTEESLIKKQTLDNAVATKNTQVDRLLKHVSILLGKNSIHSGTAKRKYFPMLKKCIWP